MEGDVSCSRLDKDNPREEKARQVLKSWYEEGYRLRYIMTEALLKLDEPQSAVIEETVLEKVNGKLSRISQLLEQIGNGQSSEIENFEGESTRSELTAGFFGMIRQAAKPRLKWY
jgi:hypothetical protein